jgi:hypothetical protein
MSRAVARDMPYGRISRLTLTLDLAASRLRECMRSDDSLERGIP